MNGFSKSTFEGMNNDSKLLVLFDLQLASHEFLKEAMNCHDKKIEQLSNEVQTVKTGWQSFKIPAVFGTLGGFLFFCGKWLIGQ